MPRGQELFIVPDMGHEGHPLSFTWITHVLLCPVHGSHLFSLPLTWVTFPYLGAEGYWMESEGWGVGTQGLGWDRVS